MEGFDTPGASDTPSRQCPLGRRPGVPAPAAGRPASARQRATWGNVCVAGRLAPGVRMGRARLTWTNPGGRGGGGQSRSVHEQIKKHTHTHKLQNPIKKNKEIKK